MSAEMSIENVPVKPETTTKEATSTPKGRWRTVGIISFLQMIENSEGGVVNSLFPVIRSSLGLSLADLGVITSIGKFGRMIFGPIWAMLGDRFGRKMILVISAMWGAWIIAAGLAQNFTQLLILYGLGVLGTVGAEPISNGLVSDLFKAEERGKVYGTMRSITGAASIVMTPLIGQLANLPDNAGWRIGMFIMGGIGVVSGILTWFFAEDPRKAVKSNGASSQAAHLESAKEGFRWADVPRLLAIPTVALLGVQLIFITSLVLFAFQVTFLVDVRHYKTDEATIITSVFFLGFTISSLVGGFLGDWCARKSPSKGRIILMQLYLVAFAIMSFLAMQIDWNNKPLEYAVWLVFGLIGSLGFSGAVLPMVTTVVAPQYRGTAFALLFSFIQGALAALLSLALGGLAQQYGLRTVMLAMVTVPYAINAIFWFVFYRVYPHDVARLQQNLTGEKVNTAE
ncbi:MAG TPA: MFS transporter [Chloroflexia bacterium]|nr:MFS transporter [Chloroflexia bacterium]